MDDNPNTKGTPAQMDWWAGYLDAKYPDSKYERLHRCNL
jgi:hypothetical protein